MPLINCKVELKLKWKKCCVLSAVGNDNDNDNDNNGKKYFYYQRQRKCLLLLYQQETIKNY